MHKKHTLNTLQKLNINNISNVVIWRNYWRNTSSAPNYIVPAPMNSPQTLSALHCEFEITVCASFGNRSAPMRPTMPANVCVLTTMKFLAGWRLKIRKLKITGIKTIPIKIFADVYYCTVCCILKECDMFCYTTDSKTQ